MITYWQGYEIDGSDTSFNIMMPEKDTNWENFAQLTVYPNNKQWIIELYIKQRDRQKITKRLQQAGIKYT
ncbi:hypothetical protein LJC72_02475 [Bacteroides sp. OttesenSCG-928-D19]|nr:hypothetical protein [Bacteroides sp. OttesenSCG-928-D19]